MQSLMQFVSSCRAHSQFSSARLISFQNRRHLHSPDTTTAPNCARARAVRAVKQCRHCTASIALLCSALLSPTASANPLLCFAYRYSGYGSSDLSRSRSSHALKSRDNSPIADRSAGSSRSALAGSSADQKDGEALSSWARYLKSKYGSKSSKDAPGAGSSSSAGSARDSHGTSSTSHALSSAGAGAGSTGRSTASDVSRRLSLGLPLRQANELASSDDDGSKNGLGSPTSPTVAAAAAGITGGIIPKQVYLRKRQQLFQLGGRGSEPGSFTWPRGLAVGPDNSIVVADSSNHRVQVFDSNGIFVKEFGEYGNGEGEFDCLAGVAVNRIGQYIIADR